MNMSLKDKKPFVNSVAVYQKYLTRLRELIIFEPWRENYHFSQPSKIFLIYDNTVFVFYLSFNFYLLSFIISNSDKHEFISTWKRISCFKDVMIHIDCVIKRDVYPQKMHSCSKNIRGISFLFYKYQWNIKKKIYIYIYIYISWVILHGYWRSRKINVVTQ